MHFTETSFEPYVLSMPTAPAIPLICDSPHSGVIYPADFDVQVPLSVLRSGEDTFVNELWASIPDVGGTLLAANFSRTYIDPNREVTDIDPNMLAEPWPTTLSPSEKSSQLGHGLLWRVVRDQPIYDRKLWVLEVENRIGNYYQPYHDALKEQIEAAVAQFGCVWHLNLHSMPSDTYEMLGIVPDTPLADFVLGDRDGTTCEDAFVALIESFLLDKGYSVARNDPYKGVQLIAKMGSPANKRHSLQVEIRRPLYMDEVTRERNEGFTTLQSDLGELLNLVAAYVATQVAV